MSNQPYKIAITGGIGSGKSFVCKKIEAQGFPIFYCDDEAKRILREDAQVKAALRALVGTEVYDEAGQLNKPMMRDYLCQGKAFAEQVDAIVHPRVAECFLAWSEQQTTAKVFMECAILYESGFDRYVDAVLLVAASEEVRISRVMQRDHVTREKALEWMSLQLPEAEKEARADFILHNNGTDDLLAQLQDFMAD